MVEMTNVLDKFSLKGRIAVVSGGRGLYGNQIVRALAQAGARTYIASRSISELNEIAEGLNCEGFDVTALQLDLASESSILGLKDEILKREGKVDILINNAVARTMKSWNDDAERFAESMTINATGLFLITRAFGNVMAERKSGTIINIGSTMGVIGPDSTLYDGLDFTGFIPDYFFHKGGMVNFTRFVAGYYGKCNVRCNCLSPGGFLNRQPELFIKRYNDRTFLGRMANDSDLMGAVVFLASDASQYITGVNIPVDGGYTAK